MHETALHELERALASGQIVTNPVELITFEVDAGLDRGRPDGVVFPRTADDVAQLVRWAAHHGVALVARGAGTGLSGGAVPEVGGVVVQFSRMNRILEVDAAGRALVAEPGVVNLTLDNAVKATGLYYPPDPSSGRSATLGGNIAENSGGPHCFKYGVTTNYVTGLDVVLADGRSARLGGRALDYPEYDFTGLVVGSEGTLAIVTRAYLRLLRNPPAVKTLMAAFESVESAGEAVSAVIAAGLVPATLEMMDQKMMRIIEQFSAADLPIEAGAALIIEADGYADSVNAQIEEIEHILLANEARNLRIARTAEERDAIWYGRKNAAGAMARLAPAYYLVDVTVPRSKLAPMLGGVNQVCESLGLRVGYVFHAGDGNLHPLILIENPRDSELLARVHRAGKQIVELCVGFEGSITGEHGVGIEKRAYMPLMYTADELDVMRDIKAMFDPQNILNPGKIFPSDDRRPMPALSEAEGTGDRRPTASEHSRPAAQAPSSAVHRPSSPEEAAALLRAARDARRSVHIRGGGTHAFGQPPADLTISTEQLRGIRTYARDDLYVTVGAGTPLAALQAELADERMWVPLIAAHPDATIGGIVASNANAPLRMRYGGVRDLLLDTTVALPDGRVIRAGRPVVKNVAGYDMPKLFIGAHGTLGLLTDVTLKLAPLPRTQTSLVVPVPDVERGLAWGARLLPLCMVASALLLCDARAVPELDLATPFALIYTAEGTARDVQIELEQVRDALRADGAPNALTIDGRTGSELWAAWLRSASDAARQTPQQVVLQVGSAPARLPQLIGALPAAGNGGGALSLIADLANGMLYLDGTLDSQKVAVQAQAAEGYSVVLACADASINRWGHAPDALPLMRALKQRWDPGGLFNPGAFLV